MDIGLRQGDFIPAGGKHGEVDMSHFIAAYWWEVHPDKEDQFRAAWRRGTQLIREKYGSLGSRLHKEVRDDGVMRYIGVAEWPDEATWRRAFDARMEYDDPPTRRAFLEAISRAADEPLLLMEVTDDMLSAGPVQRRN